MTFYLGEKCKSIIPLNCIGKFYFIETLNSLQTNEYDEFSIELFKHLSVFIDESILIHAIQIANQICYTKRNYEKEAKFLSINSMTDQKASIRVNIFLFKMHFLV